MSAFVYMLLLIAVEPLGYFIGCFSSAYYLGMLLTKRDIRKYGSGNAGTTNMIRTFGMGMGLLVLVSDGLKGALACFLGALITGHPEGAVLCGAAAVIGHNYPIFLRFRGGKGIATSLGVVFYLNPWIGLALLGLAAVLFAFTRTMSISSIVGMICYPIIVAVFDFNYYQMGAAAFILILGVIQHRENIKRLWQGRERSMKRIRWSNFRGKGRKKASE